MDALQEKIAPKRAVECGFEVFREMFDESHLRHVLLEGLELDDDEGAWKVSIGFDAGRTRVRGAGAALVKPATDTETEPIREIRTIWLRADDGTFMRLESV